jgi:hypothetical protein
VKKTWALPKDRLTLALSFREGISVALREGLFWGEAVALYLRVGWACQKGQDPKGWGLGPAMTEVSLAVYPWTRVELSSSSEC